MLSHVSHVILKLYIVFELLDPCSNNFSLPYIGNLLFLLRFIFGIVKRAPISLGLLIRLLDKGYLSQADALVFPHFDVIQQFILKAIGLEHQHIGPIWDPLQMERPSLTLCDAASQIRIKGIIQVDEKGVIPS